MNLKQIIIPVVGMIGISSITLHCLWKDSSKLNKKRNNKNNMDIDKTIKKLCPFTKKIN